MTTTAKHTQDELVAAVRPFVNKEAVIDTEAPDPDGYPDGRVVLEVSVEELDRLRAAIAKATA